MPANRLSPDRILTAVFLAGLICTFAGYLQARTDQGATIKDRLREAVHRQVAEGFRKADLLAEVIAVHLPRNVDELDPDAAIRPLRAFLPRQAAGRYVIPLEITSHEGSVVKVNTTVECAAVVKGWTARFPIRRGSLIKPENFQRKQIRVTRREQEYFTADSLPEGYQMSSNLAQGQLLRFHHLEEIPVVQRGQQVMIHFCRRSLTLISPGKTRREGKIGDLIPVIASTTGKRLYGRLVSPGIVVVE
ncbi:MAG: flagellar basal body P-ring formation protein FlgA [Fidelibacterota bacterium]|nr:MAG: flagellar basal body P-ring formation protein FlgA [Candidatus Neomarinimicrobiota bacterium]